MGEVNDPSGDEHQINREGVLSEDEVKKIKALQEGIPDIPVNNESADDADYKNRLLAEEERLRLEKLYRLNKERPK